MPNRCCWWENQGREKVGLCIGWRQPQLPQVRTLYFFLSIFSTSIHSLVFKTNWAFAMTSSKFWQIGQARNQAYSFWTLSTQPENPKRRDCCAKSLAGFLEYQVRGGTSSRQSESTISVKAQSGQRCFVALRRFRPMLTESFH